MNPFTKISKYNIMQDDQSLADYILVNLVKIEHIVMDFDISETGFLYKTRF